MRFTGHDILRFLGAHLLSAVVAGFAFMLVRAVLAIPAVPGIGALTLSWYLSAVQVAIVAGAAAILAILAATRAPKAAALIFPAAGTGVALGLSVVVDQINLTFLLPACAAGAAYGLCLHWFAWRKAIPAA